MHKGAFRKLGDMNQPLKLLLQYDKRAIGGDVANDARHAHSGPVALLGRGPWVGMQLLDAQRHSFSLLIDAQNQHVYLLPLAEQRAGVHDPAPGYLGDVDQALYPTQIDESAEISQIGDGSFESVASMHALEQIDTFIGRHQGRPLGEDEAAVGLIDLDDLDSQDPIVPFSQCLVTFAWNVKLRKIN